MKALWLVLMFTLASCGSSSNDSSGGNGGGSSNDVVWGKVAAENNPSVNETRLNLTGVDTIKMQTFGTGGPFAVLTDGSLRPDQGKILEYRVYRKSASFGSVYTSTKGSTLTASGNGTYQCSIQVNNGEIKALEGGCVVRTEVLLPLNAQIEVYDGGQLKTRRFHAMANADFLDTMRHTYTDRDRTAAVEAYLASYRAVGRTPALAPAELGLALHEYSYKDPKMEALTKLHAYVADRDALAKIISSEFNYFDAIEARKIVGLP